MNTKLIKLQDDFLVEVETSSDSIRTISAREAESVEGTVDKIGDIFIKACKPMSAVFQELNKDMYIDQAEIEVGIGFEGEGNLFLTKAKANANLTVKLIVKPKSE